MVWVSSYSLTAVTAANNEARVGDRLRSYPATVAGIVGR